MLRTRLLMGSILAVVGVGILFVDEHFAPWYPGWLLINVTVGLISCYELVHLLGQRYRISFTTCFIGLSFIYVSNWFAHMIHLEYVVLTPLGCVLSAFVLYFLVAYIIEMETFQHPGDSMVRLGLSVWVVFYLGVLPSFVIQLRWLPGDHRESTIALLLAIFVPKCCDIGAYFAGRFLGRHRMTPALSPKKTWEGALGGLTLAVLVTIGIDRLGPVPILCAEWWSEIGFGVSVGGAGVLGDLAESMIKRDCHTKDSSQVVPGFGGVLDVVDAVLFAGPVAYFWLLFLIPLLRPE